MSEMYICGAIALAAAVTFCLRGLPFLFFGKMRAMPRWLKRLGTTLPAAIMAVLVVYCLKNAAEDWIHTGVPEITAVLVVALTYKWEHNTFLSILAGTLCNMALLRLL